MTPNPLAEDATLDTYAEWTDSLWTGSRSFEANLLLATTGLSEEVGEALGVVKKALRDGDTLQTRKLDDARREALTKELGDTAYYFARICRIFDISLNDVFRQNVVKLEDRRARGVLRGEGDNR